MPSGNASDKRNSDIKASPSIDHEPVDATKLQGSMSGAAQQVKSGVLNALTGDKGSAPQPNAPQLPQDRPVIPGQVLRSIDLTLSPPDLGTVRLKLSLKSNALDIDAEASKASTAKLLDDDRKSLEQSLRNAGYDVKNLKIADASASNNANLNNSQNGAGSSFQDGNQGRMNFAGRQDNGNMQQRREGTLPDQSQQQRSPRDNNQKGSPSSEVASGRQSNAIYI
jgi:flagellar hook-length control protein FliK